MNKESLEKIIAEADRALSGVFADFDRISEINTARVLDSFRNNRVTEAHLYPSTGYGYNDRGRETLDRIYAELFGTESALVRHNIVNGTQAISLGLYGLLRPGDVMLSVSGLPYDTLGEVIGLRGEAGNGSLKDYGIEFRMVELKDGEIDYRTVGEQIKEIGDRLKMIYVQRSKGYGIRPTLTVKQIDDLYDFAKKHTKAYVVTDNCYGEFTETREPRSDLLIGSLIKNPGGGEAMCGGYLAGGKEAITLASYRLTTVGTGGEVGATLGENRNMFKGLFMAPHVVAQAKKTAAFAAYVFSKLGFEVDPASDAERSDIIESISFGKPELLCAFCRGIQSGSPVDSFVVPEPWDMPGYADKVIMAAGTFVQGSSIELSADGPLRPPYTAYFQGGLTFESGRYAIIKAAESVLSEM